MALEAILGVMEGNIPDSGSIIRCMELDSIPGIKTIIRFLLDNIKITKRMDMEYTNLRMDKFLWGAGKMVKHMVLEQFKATLIIN